MESEKVTKEKSIARQIMEVVFGSWLVIIIASTITFYLVLYNNASMDLRTNHKDTLSEISDLLEKGSQFTEQIFNTYASEHQFEKYINPEYISKEPNKIQSLIQELNKLQIGGLSTNLLDKDGKTLFSTDNSLPKFNLDKSQLDTLNSGSTISILVQDQSSQYILQTFIPIKDLKNEHNYIFESNRSLILLHNLIGNIEASVIVFDVNGNAIFQTKGTEYNNIKDTELSDLYTKISYQLDNPDTNYYIYRDNDQNNYFISYKKLENQSGINYLIVLAQSDHGMRSQIFDVIKLIMEILFILMAASFYFTHYLLKRKISEPINEVIASVSEVLKRESISSVEFEDKGEFFSIMKLFKQIIKSLTDSRNEVLTANIKIAQSESHIKNILNNVPDGIITFDKNGIINSASPASAKILGEKEENIVGRPIFEYILDTEVIATKIKPYIEKNEPNIISLELEFDARTLAGQILPISFSMSKAKTKAGQTLCIATIRDITDRKLEEIELRKAKERAEIANKTKDNFLSNMSHEIRTPMNSVMGMAYLMNSTVLNSEQKVYVNAIIKSSEALLNIFNDILDITNIESNGLALHHEKLDLLNSAEDIINILAPSAFNKNLEFIFNFTPKAPRILYGDARRIRQILSNLISNAVKFTDKGYIYTEIRIAKDSAEEERPIIEIEISDTGVGMSGEVMGRMFELFNQADNSDKRKYGGTGLGLSITKKLVELMNGKISVDSKEKYGSTFVVSLPFQKNLNDQEEESQKFTNMKVLLYDTFEKSTDTLKDQLGIYGISPDIVNTAEEFKELLAQHKNDNSTYYDAIFIGKQIFDTNPALGNEITKICKFTILYVNFLQQKLKKSNNDNSQIFSELLKPINRKQLENLLLDLNEKCTGSKNAIIDDSKIAKIEDLFPKEQLQILLVEDNIMNQQVAKNALKKLGFLNVDIAENGRVGVEKFKEKNYNIVLMDCQMPVMDGFEATEAIRQHEEQNSHTHIPIVAVTADVIKANRNKCLGVGMDDHMNKPVTLQKLAECIDKWVYKITVENNNPPT